MKSAKEDILKLVPVEEADLRSAIEASSGTKKSLGRILIFTFGFNTIVWEDWQKKIETVYTDSPNEHFTPPEQEDSNNIKEWLLSIVGQSFDSDGQYGPQCKDFANAYAQWLGYPLKPSNAAETWELEQATYWQKITYEPGTVPRTGDIVIWASWPENSFGHIAVILEATKNSFRSVDQNWNSEDTTKGSAAAIIEHTYSRPKVLGFLRPTLS
jgi:hypothetical protein